MTPPPRPNGSDDLLLLTIAHDLRNPLATLQQLVYLMEHQPDSKYLEPMKVQLSLCESVVDNVLALAGLLHSERGLVAVRSLLDTAVSLACVPPAIEVLLADNSLCVWADGKQIVQALVNVFRNAIDAMGEGKGRIEVEALESAGSVRIRISDSGPGFPASVLAAEFQPVFSAKKNGLGVGLAAAARMVAANNGSVVLENRSDGGASCSVILPLKA